MTVGGRKHPARVVAPCRRTASAPVVPGNVTDMAGFHDDRLRDLADRLRAIDDELAELGLDVLREAVAAGATSRPVIDKPIAAARRAVEKAIRSLDAAAES